MAKAKNIVTDFDPKPIPLRHFDWAATYDDYDAELVDGEWRSSCPIGYGATEQEAIADLKECSGEDE